MRNVSFHAVSIGALVDVAGTFASDAAVRAVVRAVRGSAPVEPASLTAVTGPEVIAAVFVLGLLWSVLGGYVAASIAKREEVLHGALSSYFCVALGIYGLVGGHGATPLWMHVIGFAACPALGALGGYLRARQTNRAVAARR